MRDSVSWATGRATIRFGLVGPKHDPYGRTTVEINIKGREFSLVSCALAGDWFEEKTDSKTNLLAKLDVFPEKRDRDEFTRVVQETTQFGPGYWLGVLWDRVREHRPDNYYDFDGIYM